MNKKFIISIVFLFIIGLGVMNLINSQVASRSIVKEDSFNKAESKIDTRIKEIKNQIKESEEKSDIKEESNNIPNLEDQVINKNLVLKCFKEGATIALMEKPESISRENRMRVSVKCGTRGWAYNSYHNKELDITFYAIMTYQSKYGWVSEDVIIWE